MALRNANNARSLQREMLKIARKSANRCSCHEAAASQKSSRTVLTHYAAIESYPHCCSTTF
eukprot:225283-Pleurochrysis_carterae.AAC.2